MAMAQRDIEDRWRYYEQMAGIERNIVTGDMIAAPADGNGRKEVAK
jgi:hypothetical protein